MKDSNQVDGEIYFDEDAIVKSPPIEEEEEWEAAESHPIKIDEHQLKAKNVLYERRLARWKDPFTLPQTKLKCRKMCSVGPIKICCAWRLYSKWYYRTATLYVGVKTPADIRAAVEECMKVAAIVAAIAPIVSGVPNAIAAAESAFKACLIAKLGDNLLSVRITLTGRPGDWE